MKKLKYLTEIVFLYITCICKSQSERALSCALVFVPVFVFEYVEAVNPDVVGSVKSIVDADEPYCAPGREAGSHQDRTRSNNEHQAQLQL